MKYKPKKHLKVLEVLEEVGNHYLHIDSDPDNPDEFTYSTRGNGARDLAPPPKMDTAEVQFYLQLSYRGGLIKGNVYERWKGVFFLTLAGADKIQELRDKSCWGIVKKTLSQGIGQVIIAIITAILVVIAMNLLEINEMNPSLNNGSTEIDR